MSAALPSFRLDGRRVLVTGAGRGIGLAITQACAASGAEVTLCARSAGEIGAATDELRAQGLKAEALSADVTDVQSFAALIAARPAFDVFVNNAGMNRPKPLADITVEDYDAVLGLNLRSAVFAAKVVTAAMVEAGRGGSVINMSSQMGHVGAPIARSTAPRNGGWRASPRRGPWNLRRIASASPPSARPLSRRR